MEDELQFRITGDPSLATLLYLPGLHGDWTLVGSFKQALRGRVRLIETTYPRTLTWSLDDYAAAIHAGLAKQGISSAWVLAESFGSQVAWPLVAQKRLQIEGIVLAGGFVRHPMIWGVRVAEKVTGGISMALLTRILFGYARVARIRFRKSPEVRAGIQEFLERRTELDRQAATHRLGLIARHDPSTIARDPGVPVYAISGAIDPIVPWGFVRHWLRSQCTRLRDYRIVWTADHNVLGTGAEAAAEQVIRWLRGSGARVG
jgi:pimeloyl-ACP methyl ester carboxylesterase